MFSITDYFNEKLYYGPGLRNAIKSLFRGLFLDFGLAIPCIALILIIEKTLLPIWGQQPILNTQIKNEVLFGQFGQIPGILVISVLVPIIEEMAFRLFLRPSKVNLATSFSFQLFYLFGLLWYSEGMLYDIEVVISISSFILFYYFNESTGRLYTVLSRSNWIILSSACFSLIHISNFHPVNTSVLFLYPIYVAPQFIFGLIASTIRLRYGFGWAVLLHILINGAGTWPELFKVCFG